MTSPGKTNTELILNAKIIDKSPKKVALIFDFAGQLLDLKGINTQSGLRDHPFFHSRVQYYSAREGKMVVGLYNITAEKFITLPRYKNPAVHTSPKTLKETRQSLGWRNPRGWRCRRGHRSMAPL